eukprot:Nk52_evm6s335 gene=Nk52_evmTU6s335
MSGRVGRGVGGGMTAEEASYHQELYVESREYDLLRKTYARKVFEEINELKKKIKSGSLSDNETEETLRLLFILYDKVIDLVEKKHTSLVQCRYALRGILHLRKDYTPTNAASGEAVGSFSESRRSAIINSLSGELPMWNGRGSPPYLCGALGPPSAGFTIPVGEYVAALVSEKGEDEQWILCSVASRSGLKYVVEDVLNEEEIRSKSSSVSSKHTVSSKNIRPLPRWDAPPHLVGCFYRKGTQVVALYPQTTCFYQGKVRRPPVVGSNYYLVEFVDDADVDGYTPDREIHQRFVLKL